MSENWSVADSIAASICYVRRALGVGRSHPDRPCRYCEVEPHSLGKAIADWSVRHGLRPAPSMDWPEHWALGPSEEIKSWLALTPEVRQRLVADAQRL